MFNLSPSDLERIDRDSMRILWELGIRLDDAPLRDQAIKAGAKPGRAADWIRLPEKMVRELISLAPALARYADRAGKITEMGPGAEPTFWTGAALDYVTGRTARPITSSDLAEFTRVADALPSVFAVVGTSIADFPPPARDFVGFRIMAENTAKHLRPLIFTAAGVRPILDLAQVLADGKNLRDCPLVSFGYSCLSPLHWPQIDVDLWRNSAGHRLPIMLNGEPLLGSTSPVTLAGAIALANAEILSGAALVQLIEPGRPVVHNLGFARSMDMRSAACLSGTAECALMACAGARLAAYYHLPCASWMCTDSFLDDEQAALEKTITGFAHVLGGVNVIWGLGQLQSAKALSPVQLVMDNEIAQALLRWWRGFRVDDESLAFDVIRDVVETGQDFLSHDHTLAHFRELSESNLLSRTRRETWQSQGATTLAARAAQRMQEILAAPPSSNLSDAQRRELQAIERRALATVAGT